MGNCVHGRGGGKMKAAVVEYPSGRHEFVAGGRVTAHQVMLQNPGFYLAKKSASPSSTPSRGSTYLKAAPWSSTRTTPSLLPADAPLCTGSHYHLLTFEEVFYQFARANLESMFSPRLRSSRRMQQPIANQSQAKKRSILPFSYHSSPTRQKKGMTRKSAHNKHPPHRSYF